jgi:cytochrome c554/c'-like protein
MTRRGAFPLELLAAVTLIGGVGAVSLLALMGMEPHDIADDWKEVGGGIKMVPVRRTEPVHYIGIAAGGCAAANCHGGVRSLDGSGQAKPGEEWKTSAFDFLQHDPHAQAYNVLFEERSRSMIDRLARWETTPDGGRPAPQEVRGIKWYIAQLQSKCVACHATPLPDGTPSSAQAGLNHYALGVSCEACHGPASHWGNEHLSQSWPIHGKSDGDEPRSINKALYGFHPLEDLPVAAATCAKCHIGNGSQVDGKSTREVTHDLIAAGHPRLDFDFAAWYASMPPHWNRERENRAGFCTDAWLNGQVESLKTRQRSIVATFDLQDENSEATLKPTRASAVERSHCEPDLARFDCFACHRALRFPPEAITAAASESKFPLPFGSSWKTFAQIQPEDAEAFRASISSLYRGELPTAAGLNPESVHPKPDLTPTKLAAKLAAGSPPRSFDELLSWYYAADAVARDAAFAAQSSPNLQEPAKTMESTLQELKSELERYLARDGEVSRYVSPRGFGVSNAAANDAEQPDSIATQKAFEESKQALKTLGERWEH